MLLKNKAFSLFKNKNATYSYENSQFGKAIACNNSALTL